jgi:prepilin-type N-terminal cleavage/methylation domain-containing protein
MKIDNKGFSMIELMVTVILIAILAAMAIPQYYKVVEKQKGVEAVNMLSSIAKAEERYFVINEKYTEDFTALDPDFIDSATKQPPTGSAFNAGNFRYTLSGTANCGTNGVNCKIKAERVTGDYYFERTYETGVVCCGESANGEHCELFPDIVIKC